MKRIVFLIIASLLVIGLVLPGCAGDGDEDGDGVEFEQWITFGIAGPMEDVQGENHWNGALMARDAINDAGGVDVDGDIYGIALVDIDTNEVHGTPADGITALEAEINNVDFVLGGFRTEAVTAYREVAMDAQKIFMNCGAATDALQFSVIEDYGRYKYWFKVTPYNSTFLVKNINRMMITIGSLLKSELVAAGEDVIDDYEVGEGDPLRVAIMVENLAWCAGFVPVMEFYLPMYGFEVVGTWLPAATATDLTTELTEMEAQKPHLIFNVSSGPVGITYAKQVAELEIPVMSLGINVEAQQQGAWESTNQGCQYHVFLDTFAEGVETTADTKDFFDAYVARFGDYPVYNAVTYDAIYVLKGAIEDVGSLDTDDIISYLETNVSTGVAATTAYYPYPEKSLGAGSYALSEEQVRALYDLDSYGWSYVQSEWLVGESGAPHIFHDTVYGPGYQTGVGSQWQDGHKVGVWPMDLGAPSIDQYGDWSFEYTGTVDIVIPIEWFLES